MNLSVLFIFVFMVAEKCRNHWDFFHSIKKYDWDLYSACFKHICSYFCLMWMKTYQNSQLMHWKIVQTIWWQLTCLLRQYLHPSQSTCMKYVFF